MIQEIKNSIRQLGDQDFRELRAWVITGEASRRREEPAIRRGQQGHYAAPGWTPENAHGMWQISEAAPAYRRGALLISRGEF